MDHSGDGSGPTIALNFERFSEQEMIERSQKYLSQMSTRRSVRDFSDEAIPLEAVRNAIRTAGQAPSGAHKQPWHFVLVTDPEVKRRIRQAAEAEERETYERRMSDEWREALRPLGTDAHKPFLETVPAIIVMFRRDYDEGPDGRKKNYYVQESCGIALGMLIAALHNAGIATLTHTPSPMHFLATILDRPKNEKPFMLLPVGYPKEGCRVPDLSRKTLNEMCTEVHAPGLGSR